VSLYDWARRRSEVAPAGAAWLGRLRSPVLVAALAALVLGGTAVWGFMFSRIYTRDHSRVAASRWIYHNVPAAVSLTVVGDEGPGRYMPVSNSNGLTFEGHAFTVAEDDRLEGARVLVPTHEPVTVDGVLLSNLTDPAGDPAPESFHVWLTTNPFPASDGSLNGVLAEGEASELLTAAEERAVRVALPETVLQPQGEYYVWVEVRGAPVAGRVPILAMETPWDDVLPLGMVGYAAYDRPDTPWGEGFYGSEQLGLYGEDDPAKVDRLVDSLNRVDYIVITSNRVYGAIAQLPTRYPMTLRYYDLLFGEKMGFRHLADIHSYPSLGPFEVNDQSAEEAWHVYDHPKVDVFAKTDDFDPEALRAQLAPLTSPEVRTWRGFNEEVARDRNPLVLLARDLKERLGWGGASEAAVVAGPYRPVEDVMLSDARRMAQAVDGTWSSIFDLDSAVNRSPALAVVVWYLALFALGLIAFPLTAVALRNLADRGWSVSRVVGLLATSWLAWLLSSLELARHTPLLVLSCAVVVALVAGALGWRERVALWEWLRRRWRLILTEEILFAALFVLFLAIRMGNSDLWHPYFGGEKPMDFAYLNAVLRTVSFPPYDPWFAGGQMNYYYYGFVFIGALVELTRIVPWVAYNLAIPSLAAMTGLGVFGVVYSWSRRFHRPPLLAGTAGMLGSLLAVASGNLYQVPFIARKLSEVAPLDFRSELPGVQTAVRAISGWLEVAQGRAHLAVPTHHWYWNASRAISAGTDVQPITEFPLFTFLYADLHAHMMALPITVLALATALSWAFPSREERRRAAPLRVWHLVRLVLAALAIGALWPANTWDYPTYGLVAAGAIAVAQWDRHLRLDLGWLASVLWRGVPLLALSLLFFAPYHLTYVRPYGSFDAWTRVKTPLSDYIVVHGIFLFAIVSWAMVRLGQLLVRGGVPPPVRRLLLGAWAGVLAVMGALWWHSASNVPDGAERPGIWLPAVAAMLLALGIMWLLWPRLRAPERFCAWLLVLGVALTQFVEYFVLSGDIGRMNTVFKFYIQVWVLWSVLAAVAVARLAPRLRRTDWGGWWRAMFAGLVLCGLVYTVTATRAKIQDRFPAQGDILPGGREAFEENWRPGLSGTAYQDYAVLDDDGHSLHLHYDKEAFEWLLKQPGTPTILEGYRVKAYKWGSRYSIYTGLPTVIGWDWHQKQQRNAVGHGVVTERTSDVAEIYDTTDIAWARELLDRYGVDYVIVGEMERAFYMPDGLAKFDQMAERGMARLVFENPGVRIYRLVQREARSP